MKRWGKVLLAFSLVFALGFAGCGDSGGGDDDDDNPLGPGGGDDTSGYTVSGRVLSTGGHAVPGVVMTLASETSQQTATTGDNGTFSFTGVTSGYYMITPSYSGYTFEPEFLVLTVGSANMPDQNFVLQDNGGDNGGTSDTITVTVNDSLTPVISWTGGNANTIIVMDTRSVFSNYQWEITSPERSPNAISSPVTYGVAPSGAIEEVNKPLEGDREYRVTITRWTDNGSIVGYGYFSTAGLGPDGSEGYTVSGSVVDRDRRGIAGAVVTLTSVDGATIYGTAMTDSGGDYSFTGIANGSYMVVAVHQGYTFRETVQQIEVNGENEVVSNFVGDAN